MDALTSQYNVLLEKQQQLNNVIPSRLDRLKEVLQEAKNNLENGNSFLFFFGRYLPQTNPTTLKILQIGKSR
jgi:hypothetical protein